jgi:ubiquitin-activating enzyme E1
MQPVRDLHRINALSGEAAPAPPRKSFASCQFSHPLVHDPMAAPNTAMAIDEDLYSRQLYVLGHGAMARMSSSDVLLVGLTGAGVEIAKNVALMGVKSITLFDPQPTEWRDLSAQFYLGPEDVGHPRAARCAAKLSSLNEYVHVSWWASARYREPHNVLAAPVMFTLAWVASFPRCLTPQVSLLAEAEVTEAVVRRFDVVCCVDQPEAEMLRLSALARAHGAKFVAAEARGLFCRVFCDFGASFRVDDATGETPVAAAVAAISAASPGEVTVQEERRHELQDGDVVVFSEVAGMPALNGASPLPVKVTGPFSFTIGDTSGA